MAPDQVIEQPAQIATVKDYFNDSIRKPTDAVRAQLEMLRAAGVEFDEYGLIQPQSGLQVRARIATDFLDVRHRIVDRIQKGSHVLYVPGSYDLLHVGHASYILQGINDYLEAHPGLTRDKLYVVALADDDDLISAVKPSHLYVHEGEHPRPIECEDLFEDLTATHPRLVDLASLPVDLVGFIPAPSKFGKILNHDLFVRWLEDADLLPLAAPVTSEVENSVVRYNKLVSNIREGRFLEVKRAFQCARYREMGYDPDAAAWDVGSWQFLMHRFLGDVYRPVEDRHYVRLISEHDTNYKDIVAATMALCGIGHHFVNDLELVSTTSLVKSHGWTTLLGAKCRAFEELRER